MNSSVMATTVRHPTTLLSDGDERPKVAIFSKLLNNVHLFWILLNPISIRLEETKA